MGGGRIILKIPYQRSGRLTYYLLPPSTKLRQGNVFTSMCQEFCPLGGGVVSVLACTTGHMTRGAFCPGGSVKRDLCPGGLC